MCPPMHSPLSPIWGEMIVPSLPTALLDRRALALKETTVVHTYNVFFLHFYGYTKVKEILKFTILYPQAYLHKLRAVACLL